MAGKATAKPNSVKANPKSVKKPATKTPAKRKAAAAKKPAAERPLTRQEEAFCKEVVLNGGEKSAAYRKAFPIALKWKDNSVHNRASLLHSRAKVQQRIKELQAKLAETAEKEFAIDAEYVLRRLHEVDVMDVADILNSDGSVKPILEWPKIWRQNISSIEVSEMNAGKDDQKTLVGVLKKIKWPDKTRNRELLGKHVSVNAFRDQVGLSDPKGNPITVITTEMPATEAANLYKELLAVR